MGQLTLHLVDSAFNGLKSPSVSLRTTAGNPVALGFNQGRWSAKVEPGSALAIDATAEGFEPLHHEWRVHSESGQVVLGLGRPGEMHYTQGDSRFAFRPRTDMFLARVRGAGAAAALKDAGQELKFEHRPVLPQSTADDELFVTIDAEPAIAQELAALLRHNKLDFVPALAILHGDRTPIGLRNELVVRFLADVKRAEANKLAAGVGLAITRPLLHAGNGFLLVGTELDYGILSAADRLQRSGRVEYVEPNLEVAVTPDAYTPNDTLWAQLAHLGLTDTDDAWDLLDNVDVNLRGGSPAITIAVIDPDGVTPDHPEFTAALTDGTAKLLSSTNFAAAPIAAQTVAGLGDHGTQCAGSATAAFDNNRGIAGVAPNCHLLGARLGGSANGVATADMFMWLAGFFNGSTAGGFPAALPARPADVISNSWGSNGAALSNNISDCFDFLTTYGRGGKGTVICFSLGNNGYIDFTDPTGPWHRALAAYERTIAVGASISANPTNPVAVSSHPDPAGNTMNIATAVDRRALYSPYGATALRKPDLVAPSHTAYGPALIDPVLSTVRVGTGAVDGCPGAMTCNDYATTFGGTSHATPTVAGAIALILSARPGLNWIQVRDILRASCTRIDAAQANAIGAWQDLDGNGAIDYSRWYGAGRLDVDAAVGLALDDARALADVYVRENLTDTGAVPSGGVWWSSPDIWVAQDAATPIPALPWSSAPPLENARRGQDNALFCRVRNRGTAAASSIYVRALLTHWAGLEFVYPRDFQPSTNVGAPIQNPLVPGTYLLAQTRIDNLVAGADQIVKFTWASAMIPPETVTVSGVPVVWHPCLLIEASPHDGAATMGGGTSAPVQGNNNIAQRNITIMNAGDADADNWIGMLAGTRDDVGVATLIVDARRLRGAAAVCLHLPDAAAMRRLWEAVQELGWEPRAEPAGRDEDDGDCAVILETPTRLRLDCGDCKVVIEAAPGSRVLTRGSAAQRPQAVWVKHRGIDAVELNGLVGQIEIPLHLTGGRFVPLLVAATGPAHGDLRLTQRRGDGRFSAGYGVVYR